MDILSLVDISWTAIITINLLTHFIKKQFPLIKPYCPYLVLGLSGLYAILASLISGIAVVPAIEAGFLHGAVASYVYNLWEKPSQSRTVGRLKNMISKLI